MKKPLHLTEELSGSGRKAIILSSGGVDSTTCVALAVDAYGVDNVSTVSFFYGQKHDKELVCADKIAKHYGINHYEFDVSSIMQYSNCALLKGSDNQIEHRSYADQLSEGHKVVSTYVPFRNGLFLSIAASLALSVYPDDEVDIIIGAHADDAAGRAYADCTDNFVSYMAAAIYEGTYDKVRVVAPLIYNNKAQVVARGLKVGAPYELSWSCYEGGEKACGTCATCIDRLNAFKQNGMNDPIEYENEVK